MKSGDFNRKSTYGPVIDTEVSDGSGLQMTLLSFTSRCFRVRASAIASAHFHSQAHGGPRPFPDRKVIFDPDYWFVKVASTIFVNSQSSVTCLSYLRDNLTPLVAFEVIKRFNNPLLGLKFLEFSKLNIGIDHSFWTYNFLMRSLCQRGHHDFVKLVFDHMRSDGHLPDSALLGFLVTSLLQAHKFDITKKILADFHGGDVGIHTMLCNNLLNALVKGNQVHEAILFFRECLASQTHPDTWTFNILIQGLCRIGEVDRAVEFFNDMGTFGCLPDIVTYNTLISGLCRANEVDRGHSLLKELQSKTDYSPNVVTYTSIISGFSKLGKMDEASELFEEMINVGITPNVIPFNVLIDGFGKIGDMVAAESMYEKMVSFGCLPDVVTFTSLIDGYCRSGQVNIGLRLWNTMKAKSVFPNAYTYAILIIALCNENRLHEAREFLRELKSSNVVPKAFLYNPVIDGFCKAGNVDEANLIVGEMEEKRCTPDKVTFTILIIGHCMKGRMFEGINIFNKMLAIGCAPDSITISSLVSCLLKAGMPDEAFRIAQSAPKDLNLGLSTCRKNVLLKTNADIPVAA